MIITMELPPGAVLGESYLTARLSCGRTPLREALQRLAQEELVVSVPRRGITVAGVSVVELAELIEAIILVEGFSARLATKRITDEDLAKLEQNVSKAEKANARRDFSSVAELDFEFHDTISRATGNRYLERTAAHLHRLVSRFGYIGWKREGNADASLQDHRQLIAALKDRDAAEAERLQTEHNHRARERVTSVLA
ncbi:MAG: GntR family transcriptional regulator [Chloroflexi bacterium]|nr:GntR family transcriptional regulator [Chloroflexota bacterium]